MFLLFKTNKNMSLFLLKVWRLPFLKTPCLNSPKFFFKSTVLLSCNAWFPFVAGTPCRPRAGASGCPSGWADWRSTWWWGPDPARSLGRTWSRQNTWMRAATNHRLDLENTWWSSRGELVWVHGWLSVSYIFQTYKLVWLVPRKLLNWLRSVGRMGLLP